MTFTEQILADTAPWDDPNGFWANYNSALASTFEAVFSIVADLGDVNQTVVAILSAGLSTAITTIPVQSVAQALATGDEITIAFATSVQNFTLTAPAAVGATSIHVTSATPVFPFPIGAPVQLGYVPGWSTLLDPVNCPAQFLPFLAQFNGTDIPVGLDAATARAKIIGESAQQRGTLSAVTSAITRNLSGTQFNMILERIDPTGAANAYWFIVVVRPTELISLQVLTDAVNAVKPGGVQWTLIQTAAWIISQLEAQFASITAMEAAFTNITNLELGVLPLTLVLKDTVTTADAATVKLLSITVSDRTTTSESKTVAVV